MAVCAVCRRGFGFLEDGVRCKACGAAFHIRCAEAAVRVDSGFLGKNIYWECPVCRRKQPAHPQVVRAAGLR
jgi:lipopolysaccharide biosynthesis regulator YciM